MNAKLEFLEEIGDKTLKCAAISHGGGYSFSGVDKSKKINLRCGYSFEEFKTFLKELNFNYDSGYGGQELYGTIWYIDGTWSSRGEYDGSEWWEYNSCPEIPNYLL